ncbi:MAG: hypothetical protein LAN18_15470 [Acidobacteriia bacterium]|nr:hypothetical protein [Terriglobia bacterium]
MENTKGCKCDLAALTLNSERNYKCIDLFKDTTPLRTASPAKSPSRYRMGISAFCPTMMVLTSGMDG